MTEWRNSILGDEIELVYGKGLPEKIRVPGIIPVYGSNGVVGSHNTQLVDGPGIIVGRKGSVGEVSFSNGPFWAIDTTYYVKPKKQFDWKFLYFFLLYFKGGFKNTHSTVPGLNRETVYPIECRVPPDDEQSEISSILWKIQQAIEVETDLIRVTRELKAAVMKKLFTEGLNGEAQKETEIGSVPESWEISPIGKHFQIEQGISLNKNLSDNNLDGIPMLRTSNVFWGKIELSKISRAIISSKSRVKDLKYGDLLVCEGGDIGRAAIWSNQIPECTYQNHIHRLRPSDDGEVNPLLLMNWLEEAFCARKVYEGVGNKTTIPNLSRSRLARMLMPHPTTQEEQERICSILSTIRNCSDAHEDKLRILRELFNGVLHALMSGSLQVSDLDIDTTCLEPQGAAA